MNRLSLHPPCREEGERRLNDAAEEEPVAAHLESRSGERQHRESFMIRFVVISMRVVLLAAVAGSAWTIVLAQPSVERLTVTAPAPSSPELGLERTLPPEQQGTREQEFYPNSPVTSVHAPTFVTPYVAGVPTSRSSSVRLGLSGWTAPRVPYDIPQATGGLALGLSVEWGVPRPEPARIGK